MWGDSGTLELVAHVKKRRGLVVRLERAVVGGGSEVSHQPFTAGAAGGLDGGGDLSGGGASPQPAHAAVDFQMIADRLACPDGKLLELGDVFE